MFRRILAAAAVVLLAVTGLVAAWPQLFGLERVAIIAQVVSLRGLALVVAVLLAILFGVLALSSRRLRRFLGALTAVLLAFSLLTLLVLSTRGYLADERPDPGPGDLTVLSWNTLGGAPGSQAIADLAVSEGADIVVLPETRPAMGAEIATLMGQQGLAMRPLSLSLDDVSPARTTVLLVSTALGEYRIDDTVESTPTLPSFVAVPVDGGDGPTIVAAHPVAPVPGEFRAWKQGLDWLAARCDQAGVILAGDLNSTLDHYEGLGTDRTGDLAGCTDAARATGNAAVGTWPTQLPELLGAPIDHVMTSPGWTVVGFEVIGEADGSGSDHRPIVATVRRDE